MDKNNFKNKNSNRYVLFMLAMAVIIAATNTEMVSSSGVESNVFIGFMEGDANVDPLNPDNPNIPGNGGTGESGALALNYVSHLFFDEQEISASEEDYPTTTLKPYIQVTDLRGTRAGWEVNARASKFTNVQTGQDALLGSTITFKDATCISPSEEIAPPVPKKPVVLKADGTTTAKVVTAERYTGMGTWLTRWYTTPVDESNYSVILTVPGATAMKGENIAKITWFFMDVPVN